MNKFGTSKRMIGALTMMEDELPNPFYVCLSLMAKTANTNVIRKEVFRSAVLNAGYQVG